MYKTTTGILASFTFFYKTSRLKLDWVSNWTEVTIAVWATFFACLTRIENPSMRLRSAGSVLSIVTYMSGICVFTANWAAQPAEQVMNNLGVAFFYSLYQHAFLPALLLVDAIISPISFR